MAWKVAAVIHINAILALFIVLSMVEISINTCYGAIVGNGFKMLIFAIYLKLAYGSVKWDYIEIAENLTENTAASQDVNAKKQAKHNASTIANTNHAQHCETDVNVKNTNSQAQTELLAYVRLSDLKDNEQCTWEDGRTIKPYYVNYHLTKMSFVKSGYKNAKYAPVQELNKIGIVISKAIQHYQFLNTTFVEIQKK